MASHCFTGKETSRKQIVSLSAWEWVCVWLAVYLNKEVEVLPLTQFLSVLQTIVVGRR